VSEFLVGLISEVPEEVLGLRGCPCCKFPDEGSCVVVVVEWILRVLVKE
jgi:hypothetical protein